MTIDKVLQAMSFTRFITKHGIYVVGEGEEKILMALYVNDLLIVWSSESRLQRSRRG